MRIKEMLKGQEQAETINQERWASTETAIFSGVICQSLEV